jgi:penicillin-binding protein 2
VVSKRPRGVPSRPIGGRSQKSQSGPRPDRTSLGIDRTTIRLVIIGVVLLVTFVAMYSRLWFLQVLASDEYRVLARENSVRRVDSEPPRGRILDRNGVVLVDNRPSRSVTIDRQAVKGRRRTMVIRRLSKLLHVKGKDLRAELNNVTVSPYKPVSVANDISEGQATAILVRQDRYPGVGIEELPIRSYPHGKTLAQVLGYVGEISRPELEESETFDGAKPPYRAGDLVGKAGIERVYDRALRGRPKIERVVVDSDANIVGRRPGQKQEPGNDLYLSIDIRVQKLVEQALEDGIFAARRAGYVAPDGGVVVLDPRNGEVVAMASYPSYNPSILADGITTKEFNRLGAGTETPQDDQLVNRSIAAEQAPGSTFKLVTGAAAMALGVATPDTTLPCPPSVTYGTDRQTFNNWSSSHFGFIQFPTSLEISCNTFYFELGWQMEVRYGEAFGDKTERYQKFQRRMSFDNPTGVDLPYEQDGVVPDWNWCKENEDIGYCSDGAGGQVWYPGYTVNMSIGQGDLKVTPIQMATAYGSVANGGTVWHPRVGLEVRKPPTAVGEENLTGGTTGKGKLVKRVKPSKANELGLAPREIGVLRQGLEQVVSGPSGTAGAAFGGFPLDEFPIAGKTGTAQRGESDESDAWFVSYGPARNPRYVMAVYVERADHGGTTAAPIARQVWEGIAQIEGVGGVDEKTNVSLGSDSSG